MTNMPDSFYCKKCNKTLRADNFYKSNDMEKYPEGKLDMCKDCLTMHVDNFNPDTYLWILQECDVPYLPDEWYKLMQKYVNNPEKMTGKTIMGKYLSKMQLKQHRDYRWKDSQALQDLADAKLAETMKRQNYSAVDIAEALEKRKIEIPEGVDVPDLPTASSNPFASGGFGFNNEPDEDFVDDLTEDDKIYLKLKWGKAYRPDEWVRLEQMYNEMEESYEIIGAGHKDTLKLLCKTSLKANQLIDMGDIDAYQKMSKVYDSLMKSGHFQAQQVKENTADYISSISELVTLCETEGFIPRYYIDEPNDKVDATIADLKQYTKQLVENEQNLGNLIEQSLAAMKREQERESEVDLEEDLLTLEDVEELTERDLEEYKDLLEEQAKLDADMLEELM